MGNEKRTTNDALVIKVVLDGRIFRVAGVEDFFNKIKIDIKGVDFKNQDREFGLIPDGLRLTTEKTEINITIEKKIEEKYVLIKEIPGKWDKVLIDNKNIIVSNEMTVKQYRTSDLYPVLPPDIAADIAETQDTVCEIKQTEEFVKRCNCKCNECYTINN